MCKESTIKSHFLKVNRNNNDLTFNTDIGTFSCTTESDQIGNSGEVRKVDCSKQDEVQNDGLGIDEEASFFYSTSPDGKPEWISIHTAKEFIHCNYTTQLQRLICYLLPALNGEANVVYVEDGSPVDQTQTLDGQQNECSSWCTGNGSDCVFWTLSYQPPHNDDKTRSHNLLSECGIRNYNAKHKLPTDPNQYVANRGEGEEIFNGMVFVWEIIKSISIRDCFWTCWGNSECTTWTFKVDPTYATGTCALNNYQPTRKIDVTRYNKNPNLVSGCIRCNNFPFSPSTTTTAAP